MPNNLPDTVRERIDRILQRDLCLGDEDGYEAAKAALQSLVTEARIDVLKRLPAIRTNVSNSSVTDVVLKTQIDERIEELKSLEGQS